MSPNSSSTCLAGVHARSATLRTISPCPSSGRDQRSQRTLRDAPRVRHQLSAPRAAHSRRRVRHARWYRGAIVRGGRRGFWVVPRRARACRCRASPSGVASALALRAARSPAAAAAPARTRSEPAGTFAMKVVAPASRARSRSRARRSCRCAVHNTGTQTVPNVAVTIDSFDYTSNYPELAARQATGVGDRTGPRRDRLAAGAKPRKSARPAAARRPTSTRGRSGPLAPGPDAAVRLERRPRQGRQLHGPLRRRRRALRQGQGAARRGAGRPRHSSPSTSHRRPTSRT